jgi:hypothetical protein
MLQRFRREVVFDNYRGIWGYEIDLVDLLIDSWLWLNHVTIVRDLQLCDVPDAFSIPFPERDCYASPRATKTSLEKLRVPGVKRAVMLWRCQIACKPLEYP